jgi:hypothetical protein
LSYKDRDFSRTRPRNQIRRRQPVEKFGLGDPLPPHEFLFHHRQMRRRPAKRNRAQLQKHHGNLPQRRFPDFRGLSHFLCGADTLVRELAAEAENSRLPQIWLGKSW